MQENKLYSEIKSILTNSSQCGSGKTTQDLVPKAAKSLEKNQKVLIVQPSYKLIKQTYKDIREYFCTHYGDEKGKIYISRVKKIYGDDKTKEINVALDDSNPAIIITTHAIFMWMKTPPSGWNLFIDEEISETFRFSKIKRSKVLNVDLEELFNLPTGEDFIMAEPNISAIKASLKDETTLLESKTIKDLLLASSCGNFDIYMKFPKQDRSLIYICRILGKNRFDRFDTVTLFGANIEKSIMAFVLKYHGFSLTIYSDFKKHSTPITVHFAGNKDLSGSKITNNPKALEEFDLYVGENVTDKRPLRLSNVRRRAEYDEEYENLNINCHGSNEYTENGDVVIDVSLRPDEFEFIFLEAILEMSKEEILQARMYSVYYQTIMRCCARIPDNKTPVNVYVLSSEIVNALKVYFENMKCVPIEGALFAPTDKGGRPIDPNAITKIAGYRNALRRAKTFKKQYPEFEGCSESECLLLDEFVMWDKVRKGKYSWNLPNQRLSSGLETPNNIRGFWYN